MARIFDEFEDALSGFWNAPFNSSGYWRMYKGKLVDMDRYDIVEKPEYRQKLIETKQNEIDTWDRYHQERRERLLKELDELKNKRALSP